MGQKAFRVNLSEAWSEAPELEPAYDAFVAVEVDIDWNEGGRLQTEELQRQMEKGIPPPSKIDQVISDFPDVFADRRSMAKGVTRRITTPPGVMGP